MMLDIAYLCVSAALLYAFAVGIGRLYGFLLEQDRRRKQMKKSQCLREIFEQKDGSIDLRRNEDGSATIHGKNGEVIHLPAHTK